MLSKTTVLGVPTGEGASFLKRRLVDQKFELFFGMNINKKRPQNWGQKKRVFSFLDTQVTISARKQLPMYVFKPCGCRVFDKKRLAFSGGQFYRFQCLSKNNKIPRKEQVSLQGFVYPFLYGEYKFSIQKYNCLGLIQQI